MQTFVLALAAFTTIRTSYAAPGLGVSKSARCGPSFGLTCKGSAFGNCCSSQNYCGSTSTYCGIGCQAGYGTCSSTPSSIKVSTDGSCAGNGKTCLGSKFGDCCRYVERRSREAYANSTPANTATADLHHRTAVLDVRAASASARS
jgi:hypothetical protein